MKWTETELYGKMAISSSSASLRFQMEDNKNKTVEPNDCNWNAITDNEKSIK